MKFTFNHGVVDYAAKIFHGRLVNEGLFDLQDTEKPDVEIWFNHFVFLVWLQQI